MGKQSATITNPNHEPLRIVEITAQRKDGTSGVGFTVRPEKCLKTLAPGERCTFLIQANALAFFKKETILVRVAYEDAQTGERKMSRPSNDCGADNY